MDTINIKMMCGGQIVVRFPQTTQEYERLLGHLGGAVSVGEDVWRRLYEKFKGPTDYDFNRWIVSQVQKMNIMIYEANKRLAKIEKKAKQALPNQFYKLRVEQEANKRISEQRFEAAVQRKIQELTPAGSSFK
jgi:hypothetical protein